MNPKAPFLACLVVLLLPRPSFACGGCTDAVLLMTLPWAGFGILLMWLWLLTMFATRWRLRRLDSSNAASVVRGRTLAVFAALGSVGYIGLTFLTGGSFLLPSLVIGFAWVVYLAVRVVVNVVRLVCKRDSGSRTPLVIHSAFLMLIIVLIAYYQTKANTLDHCIGCLRFGHHTQLFSKIMPRIVADGDKAVGPLIRATNEALGNKDGFTRKNTMTHATFCLGCIGGSDAEGFLSELVKQHANPSDFYDVKWYRGACFAYARCAGLRAANDLVVLFENMPHTEERDDRAFLLVALVVTGSRRGVAYTLDHMDVLFRYANNTGWEGNQRRVVQAAAECLVFGTDPKALTQIPVYRDCGLMGAIWLAEPRTNDYTSEFFWTASSENRLRPTEEIEAAWRKDSASIQKRWADLLR